MLRKVLTVSAAVGVFIGTLTGGGPVAAAQDPQPTLAAKVGGWSWMEDPWAIIGSPVSWFNSAQACIANVEAGFACQTSDSDVIRQLSAELRQLSLDVAANHADVVSRLREVQGTLDQEALEKLETRLLPLRLHAPIALAAWTGVKNCEDALADGRASCDVVTLGQTPGTFKFESRASADGLRANHRLFTTQANDLKNATSTESLATLVTAFTGSEFSAKPGEDGLAFKAWKLAKRAQDARADTRNPNLESSALTPVVTPWLAGFMNAYLEQWSQALTAYAIVLPLIQVQDGKSDDAETSAQSSQNWIFVGDDPNPSQFTVPGTIARYALPRLRDGQIVVMAPDNSRALMFTAAGQSRYDGRDMSAADLQELSGMLGAEGSGTSARGYGSITTMQKTLPKAFPADSWYTVKRYGAQKRRIGYDSWTPEVWSLYQNLTNHDEVGIFVRANLRDKAPDWAELDRRYPDLLKSCTGYWCWNADQWYNPKQGSLAGYRFDHALSVLTQTDASKSNSAAGWTWTDAPGAIEYEWWSDRSPNGYTVGPGAFVKEAPAGPVSKYTYLSTNPSMVGWPEGTAPDCAKCSTINVD